jgi:aminocarboxymuconate-semialdehyde decarboxylase
VSNGARVSNGPGGSGGKAGVAPAPREQERVVDMHTHFIPQEFARRAGEHKAWQARIEQRNGAHWVVHDQGFAYPLFETFLGGDAKVADMAARGIDVSLMSLSPTLFYYWIGAADGRSFARLANDSLAEVAGGSGGRIEGLASLPMQDPAAAAEELRRAVDELGLHGAQIGTSVEGRHLDADEFTPLWEAADALGAVLILHPYYVGPRPGLEDYYLTNSFGNPQDTALAASRLIHSGLFDRWPRVRIVLVHAGGFLPYQMGRFDHAWRVRPEPKERLDRPPSEYLLHLWFDTITHSDKALAWLVDFAGDDRVMLGTDLPYDMGDVDPVGRVDRSVGSDEVRSRVAGANAARLFGLKEAP